jgi:hypothetical protein
MLLIVRVEKHCVLLSIDGNLPNKYPKKSNQRPEGG